MLFLCELERVTHAVCLCCLCNQLIHASHAGHSLVSDIIDFEQTEDGMMVAYGICDQLDEMKHTYHGLPDFLTKAGHLTDPD